MSNALPSNSIRHNDTAIRLKTLSWDTPHWLYALHRFLFRSTNGHWNDSASQILGSINGKYDAIDLSNSIFKYTTEDAKRMAKEVDENGYYVFDQKIPEAALSRIVDFAHKAPVRGLKPSQDYSATGIQYTTETAPVAQFLGQTARCEFPTDAILSQNDIEALALDPLFLNIAQEYLGIKPILNTLNMWWSFPVKENAKFAAGAAQQYHFDMDQLKWLKFFFYLTDVDSATGPHCYVRGTHKRLPAKFRKRGRFSDDDVHAYYGADVVELTAPKGTVMAVDTRGLHKGKSLERGERLILQFQFSNSLFGAKQEKGRFHNLSREKLNYIEKYYSSYFPYI